MNKLPPYATRDLVLERLSLIFPEGTPNRNYVTRELAASTIFCLLYIGALEGNDVYLGPVHVYRMTFEHAALTDDTHREQYRNKAMSATAPPEGRRWYADNTREPIRDETLREGFIALGVVLSLPGIPTTSGRPRYYLQRTFADLFDPELTESDLSQAIDQWQKNFLSKSALTRVSLASLGKEGRSGQVLVTFPNQETRHLSAGPSSEISKAVIEVFTPAFLRQPVVLWLSTSDKKMVIQDVEVANSIGLNIQVDKDLPDIILADLAPADPLLVFVEVVATDGPVTSRRQEALFQITDAAGFQRWQVAFVTAYLDREDPAARKSIRALAWNSFAWFVSEPDKIIHFRDEVFPLSDLQDTSKHEF